MSAVSETKFQSSLVTLGGGALTTSIHQLLQATVFGTQKHYDVCVCMVCVLYVFVWCCMCLYVFVWFVCVVNHNFIIVCVCMVLCIICF